MPQKPEDMLAAIAVMVDSLKVYTPRGNIAHFVRHYPDRAEVYIFCNRFVGKFSGKLYTMNEYDNVRSQTASLCPKCVSAIGGTLERFAVLCGKHPSELPTEEGD